MGKEKSVLLFLILADTVIVAVAAINAFEIGKYSQLRDPLYEDALQFVNSDQTDKNQYNQTYNCACFARDFIVNAEKAGYKGGYVSIEFSDASHAIVCFDTSDKGPVFIEPQNDEIVDLKIGTLYAERTVLEISIFWGGFFSPQTKLVLSLIPLPCFIVFTLEARVISRKKGSRSIC